MSDRLPLFPLGTVLFPGLVLPLHVFEPRYRALVRDLQDLPEPQRRFGVVAIREGREVGVDGARALHEVGCTAVLRTVHEEDDGTFDLVTVGTDRFALTALRHDRPYLVGEVDWLPDGQGDAGEAEVLAPAVAAAFLGWTAAVAEAGAAQVDVPELPDEPVVLSHLIGATLLLDLAERQSLLECPDGVARLRAELRLLRRETVLTRTLRAVPSPLLTRGPVSPH